MSFVAKKLVSLLMISALSSFAAPSFAAQSTTKADKPLADLCKPSLTMDGKSSLDRSCVNYIEDHFSGVVSEEIELDFQANLDDKLKLSKASFEERALKTRAGNYLGKQEKSVSRSSCLTDQHRQQARLEKLADNLGYKGQKRAEFIATANKTYRQQALC